MHTAFKYVGNTYKTIYTYTKNNMRCNMQNGDDECYLIYYNNMPLKNKLLLT